MADLPFIDLGNPFVSDGIGGTYINHSPQSIRAIRKIKDVVGVVKIRRGDEQCGLFGRQKVNRCGKAIGREEKTPILGAGNLQFGIVLVDETKASIRP